MPTVVTAKKRCCQSRPRCKRCPVVLHRLGQSGVATRTGKRTYVVETPVGKKRLKAARAR